MNGIKGKIIRILPWLILACALVYTIGAYALYGECGLDSDISSEMVLAELLNEEGRLISPNWCYSTELRVISPVPLYQLGLKIFPGNWHAAHTLGLGLALVLSALSVVYMGLGAGLGVGAVLCGAALVLPVSEIHRFLFSTGGFYTGYVILSGMIMGLLLRFPRAVRKLAYAAALTVLGFVGGLSGVRMPMILMAPLFMACALEAFDELRSAPSLRALMDTDAAKLTAGTLVCGAAMAAGYLVNAKMLSATYHFLAHEDRVMGALDLSGVLLQMERIIAYFGYRPDVPLMSMRGICNVMTVAVCVLMVLCLISNLLCRRELTLCQRMLTYFAAFALGLGMLLNIALGEAAGEFSAGYYLMGVFALAMMPFIAISRMKCTMSGIRFLSLLALTGAMALQSLVYVYNYLPREELGYAKAARWLTENGYTVGCSTFWNGNVITELSDGKIRMYVYDLWTDETPVPWLQRTSNLEGLPQGEKIFVCTDGTEMEEGGLPFKQEEPAWTDGYHFIYTYEDSLALRRVLDDWRHSAAANAAN